MLRILFVTKSKKYIEKKKQNNNLYFFHPRDDKEGHEMLRLLKRCGYPAKRFMDVLSFRNRRNHRYFTEKPMRLKELAAMAIRTTLRPNAWVGVQKLPIPEAMQSFITLGRATYDQSYHEGYEEEEYPYGITCRLVIHEKKMKGFRMPSFSREEESDPILMLHEVMLFNDRGY